MGVSFFPSAFINERPKDDGMKKEIVGFKPKSTLDLTSAKIIVSGGLGLIFLVSDIVFIQCNPELVACRIPQGEIRFHVF